MCGDGCVWGRAMKSILRGRFRTGARATAAGLFLLLAGVSAAQANLLVNGSFESPLAPASSFSIFTPSSAPGIAGWSVFTPSGGNVILIDDGLASEGFSFPAEDGTQSLDLTGDPANLSAGVFQTVATAIGTRYDLSYYVGNISGGVLGTASTIDVFVNDVLLTSSTNAAPSAAASWQLFTLSFIADTGVTKIAFGNGDGLDDNYNGLDNVVLVEAPAETLPEPDGMAMVGLGFAGMVFFRRRRQAGMSRPAA